MSVRAMEAGSVVVLRAVAGIELRASTGMRQRVTHVACAKKAPPNLTGELRIESNRESCPSCEIRRNR